MAAGVREKNYGLLVLDRFRENVRLEDMQGRELQERERPENVVLQSGAGDVSQWKRWAPR